MHRCIAGRSLYASDFGGNPTSIPHPLGGFLAVENVDTDQRMKLLPHELEFHTEWGN